MYKILNKIPPFHPYDVCIIKKTGTVCLIKEVNLNSCQDEDEHQWSFCIDPFDKNASDHNAWYRADELKLLNNIFEMIANGFDNKDNYKISFPRRK